MTIVNVNVKVNEVNTSFFAPTRMKDKTPFTPNISIETLKTLSAHDFKRYCLLRADYCSFAAAELRQYREGFEHKADILRCYNKTGETLAEHLEMSSASKVPEFLTRLESLGLLVRLYYQDRKSTNLRRYLVVLDYGMKDYQYTMDKCYDLVKAGVSRSKLDTGGLYGKTLNRISKYVSRGKL